MSDPITDPKEEVKEPETSQSAEIESQETVKEESFEDAVMEDLAEFFTGNAPEKKPEEEAKTPEAEDELEKKPREIIAEPTGEPIGEAQEPPKEEDNPVWTKDLDFNDDLIFEAAQALNNPAVEGRADWTKLPVRDMSEEQVTAYKKTQAAKTRFHNEQNAQQQQVDDDEVILEKALRLKAKLDERRKLEEVQRPIPQPPTKEEPEEPVDNSLYQELEEAVAGADGEAASKVMAKIVASVRERTTKTVESTLDKRVGEKVKEAIGTMHTQDRNQRIEQEAQQLIEQEGERYLQYVHSGAVGRYILGTDPATGHRYVDPNSKTPVLDAYKLCLGGARGGQGAPLKRPTIAAQPPAGSTDGAEPELSEEFMKMDCDDAIDASIREAYSS